MAEKPFNKLALVRRSAFDTNGERKTVIIGESDDFRALAALGPTAKTPFIAAVKGADKSLLQLQFFPAVQLLG